MIEEFSFGNYMSFKGINTLNMTAAKIKSKNKNLDVTNIFPINEKLSLLKAKSIYGANSSGKSNIVKAVVAFIRLVRESLINDEILPTYFESFRLSTETTGQPSFFQLVFHLDGIRYRYGFEATTKEIKSEWLFAKPGLREVLYFTREGNIVTSVNSKHFREGEKFLPLIQNSGSSDDVLNGTTLFLTLMAKLNGTISKAITSEIGKMYIISGLSSKKLINYAEDQLKEEKQREKIINFMKHADFGINDIIRQEIPKSGTENEDDAILMAERDVYDEKLNKVRYKALFPFNIHESEGTRKIFELSPFIIRALEEGRTLFIDEFDARLHPLITKKIVQMFDCSENRSAQLIFVTHDTNLLSSDILRRDQIEFVEKDKYGESHLYSLLEFKGTRNNASFEKDYIDGKYGAIPFLGNFDLIFE